MADEYPESEFEVEHTMLRRAWARRDDVWREFFDKLIDKLDSMEGLWQPMDDSSLDTRVTLPDGRKVEYLSNADFTTPVTPVLARMAHENLALPELSPPRPLPPLPLAPVSWFPELQDE